MQSLERAFECQQQDEWGYILRARLRLTLIGYKDLKGALNDATTANQFSKVPDRRIKRTLALACLRNGKYEDAVEYAGEAKELGGPVAAHHLILAIAHGNLANASAPRDRADAPRARGQADEATPRGDLHLSVARDHFDAALAASPDNPADDGLIITADREGLWIDTLEELQKLKADAETVIGQRP